MHGVCFLPNSKVPAFIESLKWWKGRWKVVEDYEIF
jgi:hypothetical protein